MTTGIRIGGDIHRASRQDIEGPSRAQAVRMASARESFLAEAERIASVNPQGARNLRDDAANLERDLRNYGFDIVTGLKARRGAR